MKRVSIQTEDFNAGAEYQALIEDDNDTGAAVFFVGRVRSQNDGRDVTGLYLEHYPGMTESSVEHIIDQAQARWPIQSARVIHRVGTLSLGEQIVFVGVTSPHRQAAFQAAEFIMDYLKTRVPLWKKERGNAGEVWLNARSNDQRLAQRWDEYNSEN